MKGGLQARWESFHGHLERHYTAFCSSHPRAAKILGFVRRRRRPLKGLFVVFVHALGFALSIQAVMQTRTEQGAVAWAFALNTLPVLAVPAWFVFGNHKLDTAPGARRPGRKQAETLTWQWNRHAGRFAARPEQAASTRPDEVLRRLQAIASLPVTEGNSATLLVDGSAAYPAMLRAISGAERYILMQSFIFREDGIGRAVRDALVAKAHEGVAIYLLLDSVGSHALPAEFAGSMERHGIRVAYFTGMPGKTNRFQLNFRNHRKILVVDGTLGFLGGLNVGDDYLGKHPRLTPWRDTHMQWRGPVAKCLQVPFAEDWHSTTGSPPGALDWELRPEEAAGPATALCLASGPGDPVETCAMAFLILIHAAQDRIWLATPYFVPDDKIVTALQLAAMRGVDVRVILPELSDSRLMYLASFSSFEALTRTGVRFFRFQNGFLHQKVMIVDDWLSAIGSANIDNRSFRLNHEVIGIVSDRAFNAETARMLEADLAHSLPSAPDALSGRSFWFRLGVRLSRMLVPVL